jgi:Omp85 superfamily domain
MPPERPSLVTMLLIVTGVALWACSPDLCAQQRLAVPDTIIVVPGPEYQAGWLHALFFGTHWRDAWTLPVRAEVLDLKSFAGGLTPVKQGGGLQTKTLRFRGGDGKQYKFRSLNKDPSKVLPEELRESLAADIMQDQISSANPYAPFVLAPMLRAVGVLNAEPRLVFLPDDERLGEFRAEFGNLLGTIEVAPTADPLGDDSFAGAEKIVDTYELFRKVDDDHDQQVDQVEFLKARLIDIYLGDWDRHVGQWRWAGFKDGGKWRWVPIPRDRDQAFSRFDGVLPWIAANTRAILEDFGDTYPKMEDLSWSGRYLDRRFLGRLPRVTWDSIVGFLQQKITPELIDSCVRLLPAPLYEQEGGELKRVLMIRIATLPFAAAEFYDFHATYAAIRASNKDEVAEIVRLPLGAVSVSLWDRGRETGMKKGEPFFQRVFYSDETEEIRLSMLGGDDRVVVTGHVESSIEVHVDGGEGRDDLIDSSSVRAPLLGLPWPETFRTYTYFYDTGRKTTFTRGPGTVVRTEKEQPPVTEKEKWEPPVRDFGYDWRLGSWLGFTPDDGLFLGAGPILYRFGFHDEPYAYRLSLLAGIATKPGRGRIDFTGDFPVAVTGARLFVDVRASGIDFLNFYGFGNQTKGDLPKDRTRVEQRQITVLSGLEIPLVSRLSFTGALAYSYASTVLDSATLAGEIQPYGTPEFSSVNLRAQLTYDSRDLETFPQKGIYAFVQGSYALPVAGGEGSFGNVAGEVRTYLHSPQLLDLTLALRAKGEKVFGSYPFFRAAFLGGGPTLRGFPIQRFAGDASLLGSVELRLPLVRYNLLVPSRFGITTFGETGRVFLSGEESSVWHPSAGGGLWFSFINLNSTLAVTVARSSEATGFYLTFGLAY